jgi:hypothetical protein
LRGEMDVEMALAGAAHPLADHQGFGEIGEIQQEAAEVEAGQADGQRQAAQVAGEVQQKSFDMGGEGAGDAVRLNAVGVGGFIALVGGEFFGGTVGGIDGGGVDAEAEGAQGQDFAQDEGHGEIGVAADQVGDGRRLVRGGFGLGGWRHG